MTILSGKALQRLREEFTQALIESLSQQEVKSYLTQVLYNSVATVDGEALRKIIVDKFGEDFYATMIADVTDIT